MTQRDNCLAGADREVEDIYDALAPLLFNIATGRFGVPRHDAEGLVQDVFTTFLTQRGNVRAIESYLIAAICNASRSYWHRRKREDQFVEPLLDQDPAHEFILDDQLAAAATATAVMAGLRPRCRQTLWRFYVNGESAADIANGSGTTPTYIFNLLQRCKQYALKILRERSSLS